MIIGWMLIKVVHVLAGILWVGSAAVVAAFIMPSARALGPQAAPFMKFLMQEKKMSQVIMMASGLNAVSGLVMYWRISDGFSLISLHWPGGIGLMIGMISGLFIFLWGHVIQGPNAKRLGQMTAQLSGAPTPEQANAIQLLQDKLYRGAWFGVVGLTISVVGMTMIHI